MGPRLRGDDALVDVAAVAAGGGEVIENFAAQGCCQCRIDTSRHPFEQASAE